MLDSPGKKGLEAEQFNKESLQLKRPEVMKAEHRGGWVSEVQKALETEKQQDTS